MSSPASSIRPAAVAGTFYPGDAAALRAQLSSMLSRVGAAGTPPTDSSPTRPPKILIAPHAGYQYSGPVAANAYRLLAPHRDAVRRVVLIGPAHRVAFRGIAAPTVAAFGTPLGRVPIDTAAIASIAGMPRVVNADEPHAWEHALEVHLPFLQMVLGEFVLVPLVVGDVSGEDVAKVLDALWGGEETLIVVSSDLSHYHEHGQATRIDAETVREILALNASIVHEQACGATPINGALMCAGMHGLTPRLLDLRNSGDTSGDRARVVGYCSVAFEPGRDGDVRT